MTAALPAAWQAHHAGLDFLATVDVQITTATTITGPCVCCDGDTAVLRVYGQPAPNVLFPVECEEVCAECGPWIVSLALEQQDVLSRRPIQVEVQAGMA